MNEIQLFDLGYCKEEEYTRVVCVCRYQGNYIFSYNKKREGYEIPGGHIEEGETWIEACKREVYEETGGIIKEIRPICVYKISSFGILCFAEIEKLDELPKEFEMEKIVITDELPENLSFKESHTLFFNKVLSKLEEI